MFLLLYNRKNAQILTYWGNDLVAILLDNIKYPRKNVSVNIKETTNSNGRKVLTGTDVILFTSRL